MKKKNKNDRKFRAQIIVFVLVNVVMLTAITYGIFLTNKSQAATNQITSGCFSSEFTDGKNSVTLANALPTSNTDGLTSTPYTFTLKNTCTIKIKYTVLMDVKNDSFNDAFVATSLDGTSVKNLDTYPTNTAYAKYVQSESGYSRSYVLKEGELAANETLSFSLRAWLREDITYESVSESTADGGVKGLSWDGQIHIVNVVAQ